MQVVRAIGGRAPLHLTSVGKLFLSQESPEELEHYAQRTLLKGSTKNSITNLEQLKSELIQVRSHKSATDNEELELGVRCIAAGIYDDQEQLVAGLSISAPADRLQEGWMALLEKTAKVISNSLGHKA